MADKILIVEDSPRVVQLVRVVLEAVGYEVIAAGDGTAGIERAALDQPDLILLDILLPGGMDGYQVCRRIREFSDVAVIMLTAKGQDSDKLTGFDAGADDYLPKPFNARELVARVEAVLRRSKHHEDRQATVLACGEIEINLARRTVKCADQFVSLTPTEYALLRQLAFDANRVVLHQDLLARVWGPEYRDEIQYLRLYINYLRQKIEVDPAHPTYILTERGVGYRFVEFEEQET